MGHLLILELSSQKFSFENSWFICIVPISQKLFERDNILRSGYANAKVDG